MLYVLTFSRNSMTKLTTTSTFMIGNKEKYNLYDRK